MTGQPDGRDGGWKDTSRRKISSTACWVLGSYFQSFALKCWECCACCRRKQRGRRKFLSLLGSHHRAPIRPSVDTLLCLSSPRWVWLIRKQNTERTHFIYHCIIILSWREICPSQCANITNVISFLASVRRLFFEEFFFRRGVNSANVQSASSKTENVSSHSHISVWIL